MNRCLTEGRQALAVRLAGIEGGIECAKLAPLRSALADGEASADDLALLRPHLKTCLSCRARLRLFREAPTRVAALVPAAALLAAEPGAGPLRALFDSIMGPAQHKAAAFGERAHAAAELAAGQKVAALAASAAALAGGGTAVDQFANQEGAPVRTTEQVEAKPVTDEQARPDPTPSEPLAEQQPAAAEPAPAPAPEPQPPLPPPPPDPADEFAPTGSAPTAALAPTPAATPAQPAGGAFTPGARGAPGNGPGAGEFAP